MNSFEKLVLTKFEEQAKEIAAIKGWLKGTVGAVGLCITFVLAKGC